MAARLPNAPNRHCEELRDEAIHLSTRGGMDCFAALAMTAERPPPHFNSSYSAHAGYAAAFPPDRPRRKASNRSNKYAEKIFGPWRCSHCPQHHPAI
jgi:hypothetical protein